MSLPISNTQIPQENNENEDGKNRKEEKNEEEESILYKGENNINFRLLLTSITAKVVKSPETNGDIIIPKFVDYDSKQFIITSICDEAFKDSLIESISFSDDSKVNSIGNFAFENSTIHKLFIPQSLTKLCKQWAQGAKELNEIIVDENNHYFSNESGFLIYKQQVTNENEQNLSKEICFAPKNFEGQFQIPNEITSIGRFAFSQRNGLIFVKSESSTPKKLKSFSFFKCNNLRNVILKGQSDLLLGGCCFSQSENLSYVDIACKTIVVGKNCFENCSSLNTVNLNASNQVSLGSHSFKGCSSLESILIFKAESIKIGDECFANAINFKSATFVATSITLGNNFFMNCPMLSYVTIESSENLSIPSNIFRDCNLKYVKLVTSSALHLNEFCFNSKKLESIELSFKSITAGKNCFTGCSSLSIITLQSEDGFKIFNEFFSGCKSLKKLNITSKSEILISDHFMNESPNLEAVEMSGMKISIGSKSFNKCQSLSHFSIKNSGEVMFKEDQFVDCDKLEKLEIQCSIVNLCQNQICNSKSLKHIKIESNSNIFLRSNCFDGFNNLENVLISGENIVIEENCFKNCSNLNKLLIHKAKNLKIGSYAFHNCKELNEIDLKVDSDLILCDNCFNGSNIEKAVFEGKIIVFEKSCFEDHITNKSTIKSINIKGEKIKIGDSCFNGCSELKTFSISSAKDIIIENNAFENCSILENVAFDVEEKLKILNNCFYKSQNLKSFKAKSTKSIEMGIGVFEDCNKLESVLLKAENKINLLDYCFSKATSLKTFEFSCNEAIFHENCFYGCMSLKNFSNNNTDKIILFDQAFNCCDNLEYVEIGAQSEFQAGKYCFDRLMNLKKVVIKSRKVKLGDFCFNSCTALSTLSFPNVDEIMYYESFVFECCNVNVSINPNANKKEIKSEKIEMNKQFINLTNDS